MVRVKREEGKGEKLITLVFYYVLRPMGIKFIIMLVVHLKCFTEGEIWKGWYCPICKQIIFKIYQHYSSLNCKKKKKMMDKQIFKREKNLLSTLNLLEQKNAFLGAHLCNTNAGGICLTRGQKKKVPEMKKDKTK